MPIAVCFNDYNYHMAGVNIIDQLCRYYNIQLTSFQIWWLMIFWGLDTMATNTHPIYSNIEDRPVISHKGFRLQCAWGLILTGPSPQMKTCTQDAKPKPTKKVYIKSDTTLPLNHFGLGYMPIHLPLGKKLACWLCRWKRYDDGRVQKPTQNSVVMWKV